jgi:hypothetical protein
MRRAEKEMWQERAVLLGVVGQNVPLVLPN